MIELINVTKWFPTEFGRHYVFRDVSLRLPPDKSVGVMGPNGAGKSTLLRIMAGADIPNEGRVIRTGRISPPMGLTPSLLSSLTGDENARFACRIYGMDRDEMEEVVEKVEALADIGKYYAMPVSTYSAGMRQRVAFSISMMLHYDYYLFDEIGAGGDRQFQETSKRMVRERLATSKFVITSHRVDELVELCEACIIIMNGELKYFDKIADGLSYYGEHYDLTEINRKIERKTSRKERKARIESGQLPATREERRAAKKELRKKQASERAGEAPETATSTPVGEKSKKSRRRRSRKQLDSATEVPAAASAPADLVAQHKAGAAPILESARIPARKDLPMAPRFKLPPAELNSQADQRIAELRMLLAQRTGAENKGELPPALDSELGIEPISPGTPQPGREGRNPLRKARRRSRGEQPAIEGEPATGKTPGAGTIARNQEKAAHKAGRAVRLLMELLDASDAPDSLSGMERSLALAIRAQEAAAVSAAKASAGLLALPMLGSGVVAAEEATDSQLASRSRRSRRRRARQRRRATRQGNGPAQPMTGTSN